jgi:hypothetical protein
VRVQVCEQLMSGGELGVELHCPLRLCDGVVVTSAPVVGARHRLVGFDAEGIELEGFLHFGDRVVGPTQVHKEQRVKAAQLCRRRVQFDRPLILQHGTLPVPFVAHLDLGKRVVQFPQVRIDRQALFRPPP